MRFPYFRLNCPDRRQDLEFNDYRTAAYLNSTTSICAPGDMRSDIQLRCSCEALAYEYCDGDTLGTPVAYSNPADDCAPWYDESIPESGQFLGFMIEDVVQNVVTSRTVRSRISSSGGGVIGPLRSKERRLDFTVLMFACNEPAMEYGFRYLNDALNAPGCEDSGCDPCDAEFRDSCPEVDNTVASLDRGRWILHNAGAVDGPTWADAPTSQNACNIRRVKFSIASEFPWKFKPTVTECENVALDGYPADGAACVNWSDIICGVQEVSCSVTENLIIGETALIIEVTAGSVPLQHVQIAIRPDKFGYECNEGTRPVGYARVTPYDQIYIPYLPASAKLTYDTAVETIKVRLGGSNTDLNGSTFIATQEGKPPTYPAVRCGTFCISVAASECSVVGGPTVTIKSVHREI